MEEEKDKANALVETKTWRLSEDDDEDDDNDDEEDSRPWRGCCIATRNAKTLEGQIELVEEDEFTHIVGSINEGELRRILLIGPNKARSLVEAAQSISLHVVRREYSTDECLQFLQERAKTIHEARWRIDFLRAELGVFYVSRLRQKPRAMYLSCLLDGHEGAFSPEETRENSAKGISSSERRLLLAAIGIHPDRRAARRQQAQQLA